MGNPLELLIVDDDPDEKPIMRRYINRFQLAQFNLTWSEGIEETIELFTSREFDAVLMDYRLRDGTAIDLIERCPQRVRRLPIIIITNFDDVNIDQKAYELGVEFFINKNDINERVLERTIRYAMRNKELQNRLKDFSSMLLHDLQSPLNSVSSLIDVLTNPSVEMNEKEASELLQMISGESAHLRLLINELGRYTGTELFQLKLDKVDLNELFNRVLKLLRADIEESNATIEVAALPTVFADSNIIVHVFMNLVSNAIKYVADQEPHVSITAVESDAHCRVAIKDNGIGIDADDIDRIFKPLVRLHARSEYGGTGLGLAICRQFVDKHGGRIWVESEPGRGSTFFVELARAE